MSNIESLGDFACSKKYEPIILFVDFHLLPPIRNMEFWNGLQNPQVLECVKS